MAEKYEFDDSVEVLKKINAEKERQLKLAEELLIKQEKEYDEQLEKQAKFHYKHLKENQQLKQQLHELPKKIVGEIRKEIEFPLYVHPDFDEFECVFDIDKLLDTILKKYGGNYDKENKTRCIY